METLRLHKPELGRIEREIDPPGLCDQNSRFTFWPIAAPMHLPNVSLPLHKDCWRGARVSGIRSENQSLDMHNKRSSPSTLPVFLPNLSFSFHREEKKEEGSLLEVSSHEPVKLCGNGSWRRRGWWTSVRRDAGREHEATKRRGNVSENVSARSCPTC